jgi:prepilin-type N-terminal cleavage/methylation domain-containing protein
MRRRKATMTTRRSRPHHTSGAALAPARGVAAFTLVEMLVVIAIISILAGLLLPALVSAREKGRQTDCTNAMRQFALSIEMYSQDYGGYMPMGFRPDAGTRGVYAIHSFPRDHAPEGEEEEPEEDKDWICTWNGPTGLGLLDPTMALSENPEILYKSENSAVTLREWDKLPERSLKNRTSPLEPAVVLDERRILNMRVRSGYYYAQGGHGRHPRLTDNALKGRAILMGFQGVYECFPEEGPEYVKHPHTPSCCPDDPDLQKYIDLWVMPAHPYHPATERHKSTEYYLHHLEHSHGGAGTHILAASGRVMWYPFGTEMGIRQFNVLADPDEAFRNADKALQGK